MRRANDLYLFEKLLSINHGNVNVDFFVSGSISSFYENCSQIVRLFTKALESDISMNMRIETFWSYEMAQDAVSCPAFFMRRSCQALQNSI